MNADAASYDQVPYTSLAFPQTHPDHLAAVACIFGLAPPDVSRCRVLELGCAGGGNLIPMAFNLPASEFVGIDHSPRQVADARAAIDALGLRNIRIEAASIEDVDRTWGTFDYIICHGVFSWVDAPLQDHILRLAGEQLSPQGVAYVSYNTFPGWHMRRMVRDMMRYHAAQFANAGEQIAQARALVSFLAKAADQSTPYAQWLHSEADRAARADDSYVFHEHLERTNLPLYFHEFVARAGAAGLQFLSEASVTEMLTTHFPPEVAETLERISADILHLEQYLDFVRNRQFRQTLLCRADAHPRRALDPSVLRGRLVSGAAVPEGGAVPLDPEVPVRFSTGGRSALLTRPATKAAFALMAEAWPAAIGVDALCDQAVARAGLPAGALRDEAAAGLLQDVFSAVLHGLVTMHTVAPPCTNVLSERPRAHPLAQLQAERGPLVVNAHHQMVELDSLAREALRLADGRRCRDEMLDAIAQNPEAGAGIAGAADFSGDPADVRSLLSPRLGDALGTLAHRALLIA